ncbi:binding-protein-dependent transport systems inner membrane component [Beutenbergia cavernae DSM 12333]|uniref:Binding-protein-dependent transport systems inner membrane component n=1 Tax=Beutenbergia cavernae (strain ATCC BAA-8 / DSM 12333 / CCUG 43141 / JCM 11478 / NBRC 16432 / NCIMB 13614 / HKI 0122) TaxID=471853 RepID=C5C543_BEUC1|nr:sugar ABC transporter permease [Beutenbergia cavernae]ACQ82183.1 binding-protein-dependent transport systems inner membrane component [Beutenbergia cavernae DSM 12333]
MATAVATSPSTPKRAAPSSSRRRARRRATIWGYVFLLPLILIFGGFTLWPIVASWGYSFFDWDGVGPPEDFVGLANFSEALGSASFWNAFGNSFLFSLGALLVELPLALILALVLNNTLLRGRNVYRLAFFLPVVATTAVIGMVIAVLLSPVGGVVNEALRSIGLIDRPINFLGSPSTALPTVIGVDIWKGFGITLIYWLAALQTVPKDLYEAAKLDGASPRQQLASVTLPVLMPLAVVILLLTFQRSLNTFDLVQSMTGGGPVYSTDVVPTYIYRYAFDPVSAAPRYGFACAVGVVFGLFTLLITLLQGPLLAGRMRKSAA